MPQNLTWIGYAAVAAIIYWSMVDMELTGGVLINMHGIVLVLGGMVCSTLISFPTSILRSALSESLGVFLARRPLHGNVVAAEILRLGQLARRQGGLLALQNESPDFADGFLSRTVMVAIATNDEDKVRDIMETEVRDTLNRRQEAANVLRAGGILAPMFGLLGTLMGIILVLRTMEDPSKVGPAMATAITASLYGIGSANLFFIPLAGAIRSIALDELRIREMILEGVLEIMKSDSVYQLEMRMRAWAPTTPTAAGGAPAA